MLTFIPYALARSMSLLVRSWSSSLLPPIRSKSSANRRSHKGLPSMEMCGGHGVFSAWSSLRTSWTGRVRVCIPDWHLLLYWIIPTADCSRRLHCWSSHIMAEWLEPFLHLYWSFCWPATGLHARLCQTPSWSLWSCWTYRADVVGASLWWLDNSRSVLLCSGLV